MIMLAHTTASLGAMDPVPKGVDLGGWLVLEDWFYGKNGSKSTSAFHVSTPTSQGAVGWSLNIDPAGRGFLFSSEVDLIAKSSTPVASLQHHRDTYFNVADELEAIASYGIKYLRLPITWCFNWRDEPLSYLGTFTNVTLPPRLGEELVDDPFQGHSCGEMGDTLCRWLAIPESRVLDILVRSARLGLKVLLDVHAFPGGASDGTYNGVWPLPFKFWDNNADTNFRTLIGGLIAWAEELATRNATAFQGLYGIQPMNEPALGDMATRAERLSTLTISLDLFRSSQLPTLGKRLMMNLFGLPDDASRAWWLAQTTEAERAQWAVIDLHHYVAWPGTDWCSNSSAPLDELEARITQDSDMWQFSARDRLLLNGTTALVAMSEFSGSTHEDTRRSCSTNNLQFGNEQKAQALVRHFVQLQVATSRAADVLDFFWKWHLPFNSNFQTEWSLKHILATSHEDAPLRVPPVQLKSRERTA
jgi:hypothetical protein